MDGEVSLSAGTTSRSPGGEVGGGNLELYGTGEDTGESLDSKEIKSVNPKGNQP